MAGVIAGAAGTLAMDLLWFARYKRQGGSSEFVPWEFSAGLDSWDSAPAPAQVGRRIVEGLFQTSLAPTNAALTNNLTHPMWEYDATTLWKDLCAHLVYGIGTAALFKALTRRTRERRSAPDWSRDIKTRWL